MNRFAFYGSLRNGLHNYDNLSGDTNFKIVATSRIPGYQLISIGSYPTVLPDPASDIVVEFVEVEDQWTADNVINMETGAGYVPVNVEFQGQTYVLWVAGGRTLQYIKQERTENPRSFPAIPGGDWLAYVEAREKLWRMGAAPTDNNPGVSN